MKLVIMFVCYVILASSGLILFKLGSTNSNLSLKMIIGLLCYGFSFILWMFIVSKMNLTVAMPLSVAIVNTLVVLESCLILKEKITLTQGIGIFIVIIGVSLMSINRK